MPHALLVARHPRHMRGGAVPGIRLHRRVSVQEEAYIPRDARGLPLVPRAERPHAREALPERLGVDPSLPRYKESWWEGGGNSGPCFEVVFGGAEPATLVFMMNREVNGHRIPMETQVVDTGYGLERLTWLSQATTSAYEAVFGEALAYLKRATGAKRVDNRVLREYSKVAGMLKVETLADIRLIRQRTAERVGISVDQLIAHVSPLESLYTVCDHSRALIFLLGDGVVPSNSREGYFARLLVRRGLRVLKDLNITYSLADTVSFMIDQIREDYPEFFL